MRQRNHQSQHEHAGGMYADAQQYVNTRCGVSRIVSSLIFLALIIIGVLIIYDIWNFRSAPSVLLSVALM